MSTEQATRYCPACAEQILAAAKKCKHCGEWSKPVDDGGSFSTQSSIAASTPLATTPPVSAVASSASRFSPTMKKRIVIAVAVVAVVGVVAIPLASYIKERAEHERHLRAIDLSTLPAAAKSLCIALMDGQQDIIDAVVDEGYYKDVCRLPPVCTAEKQREALRSFVQDFNDAGSGCTVVGLDDVFDNTAVFETLDGVTDRARFVETPTGWRPRRLYGPILIKTRVKLSEANLRRSFAGKDGEKLIDFLE